MALDQVLLTEYPQPQALRFRHYEWTEDAFTFGFAQPWGHELEALAENYPLIRRETGGGLVDHRNDWTWTLILPLSHPAAQGSLTCLYSGMHKALHVALRAQGVPAELQDIAPAALASGAFRQCFTRAERDDVVLPDGHKLAGAAQRRTRDGVLVQGYVDKLALPQVDWALLEREFTIALGTWLESPPEAMPMPLISAELLENLSARFASEAWNQRRKRS